MLFAAACAALAACNVSDIEKESPAVPETKFHIGQTVTLSVSAGTDSKTTKVSSALNEETIDFKWQKNDKIKVTVGGVPSEFTLENGEESANGTFKGTILGEGNELVIQYPYDDPDISSQTYSSAEAIPHDKMKFTGTGTTTEFTLTPVNSVLRLNLNADATIGKIVVTDKSATPEVSYTLTCTDGVKNNTGKETIPFFIVLPAGSSNFEAKVYGPGETPSLICTRATNGEQTFVNGKVLNMPLKSDYPGTDAQPIAITTGTAPSTTTTVWASVNCGYVAKTGDSGAALGYPYGKLYQWGRKDGQGYDSSDATYPSGDNIVHGPINYIPTSSEAEKFYIAEGNWYNGTSPAPDDLWGSSKTEYDPCPEGWRVPTNSELEALMANKSSWTTKDGQNGFYFSGSTAYSESAPSVFLPAVGFLNYQDGIAKSRGVAGLYWSSSVHNNPSGTAWTWSFSSDQVIRIAYYRTWGFSVRCVKQ